MNYSYWICDNPTTLEELTAKSSVVREEIEKFENNFKRRFPIAPLNDIEVKVTLKEGFVLHFISNPVPYHMIYQVALS